MEDLGTDAVHEQWYRVLIENAPEPVFILDAKSGKFIDFNNKAVNFFKLTKKALLSMGPLDFTPKTVYGQEAAPYAKAYIEAALKGANPVFKWIHLDSEGLEIPCEVRLVRFPPYDKELVRASVFDLTKEKQLEQAIIEREERLQLTLKASGLGCFDWDLENGIIHWDEQLHHLFGLAENSEKDRNEHFFKSLHPEDKERVQQNFANLISSCNSNTTFKDQYRIIKGNKVCYLISEGLVMRDDQGKAVRVIGTCRDVTIAKEAEEQLHYQAALLENVSDAIISTGNDFKIKSWNKAAEQMYGWQLKEVLGKKVNEVISISYVEETREGVLKEFRENGIWRGEVLHRNKNGKQIFVMSSVTTLRDTEGKPIGAIAVNRDITQRKAAEDALKKSEYRYRMLAESSHDLIWEVDKEGHITFINSVAKEVYGYDPEEMIGWNFTKLMTPESLEDAVQLFQEILSTGKETLHYENEVLNNKGEVVILDAHARVRRDEEGNIIGTMGTSQDITVRKKAEAKLLELNQRFELSTKAAKVGIWDWDIKTDVLIWDETMCALYGLEKDSNFQISYKSWLEYIHLEDLDGFRDQMKQALIGKKDLNTELRIIWSDKTEHFIKILATVQRDEKGGPLRMVGTNWDITKEKEAEYQKLRAQQLELKNKQLEQFAYLASHDLQEPLRTISGFVGLLKQQNRHLLGTSAQEYLDFISQASNRMNELIKDLLDYSQIGSNKKITKVDCNLLVHHILNDLDAQISDTGADFELQPLPQLVGYKTELRSLFQNLISNAIKFRKPNRKPVIKISAQKKGNQWEFCIADNGIGIDPEFQKDIFSIFKRLHPKDKYKGNGIGLAHCQKIVELYGGDIWVESQSGQGSAFYFTVPV